MAWRRLGQIYAPDGSRAWARSHAALPIPVALGGDRFRVFFSARDADNRSSVGWVDIILDGVPRLVAEGHLPVLEFGTRGMFDDSGVSGACIVSGDDAHRLYYLGWNLAVSVPWRNSIGVVTGTIDPPSFTRLYDGPIIDRSPENPFLVSYPWVLRLGPADWRMWYGSHLKWGENVAENHVFKTATSDDGLRWRCEFEPVLTFSAPDEYTFSRPAVLHEDGIFRMWFALRGSHYRIGYAQSPDGRNWTRDDTFGLSPSGDGWDSDMTCYPCAFRHQGTLYLAYNGNDYGRSGFGLAVWE